MSGLSWKLRRLGAMSGAEVVHRARVSLRDHLWPPAYASWSPEEACRRLFDRPADEVLRASRLPGLVRIAPGAPGFEAAGAAARALRRGAWTLFGNEVTLDDPPRWRANPLTGAEWPDLPSRDLDHRRIDLAGGARHTWELGRLTMLPTLALSWRLWRDEECAACAVRWLDDWAARNPLGRGIHQTSGTNMAVRVFTTAWTLALLGDRASGPALERSLGLLAQQALYCRDHLSLGSSANNHLIAEYGAMAAAGALFPSLRGADALAGAGFAGLEREALRQIHPDGVTAEQAFGYQPFIWELLVYPLLAGEAAGRGTRREVRERLAASLEFARAIRLPDGRWPQVGDEDDGRILLAIEGGSRLDLVGNALAAWLGADGLAETDTALARLLLGRSAAAAAAGEGRREFEQGGYSVWRAGGLVVTFDHGPLGLGAIAAHGHADALSLTAFRGADAVVVDPGTFAYHEDPEARERCRGTPVHSTVHFGGRSQAESLGPFLWGTRPRVAPLEGGHECVWPGGERHWRRVEVAEGRVIVEDRVAGRDAEVGFALHPDARVELDGTRAAVRIGATLARFEAQGLGPWRLVPAEYAPRFSRRLPATRLAAAAAGRAFRTVISFV